MLSIAFWIRFFSSSKYQLWHSPVSTSVLRLRKWNSFAEIIYDFPKSKLPSQFEANLKQQCKNHSRNVLFKILESRWSIKVEHFFRAFLHWCLHRWEVSFFFIAPRKWEFSSSNAISISTSLISHLLCARCFVDALV